MWGRQLVQAIRSRFQLSSSLLGEFNYSSIALFMVIKSIRRSYSKTINTKDYGLPDSWLKVESEMSAEVTEEENKTIASFSAALHQLCVADVVSSVNQIIVEMKKSKNPPASHLDQPVISKHIPRKL